MTFLDKVLGTDAEDFILLAFFGQSRAVLFAVAGAYVRAR